MPNIADLFKVNDPAPEGGSEEMFGEFDPAEFLRSVDEIMDARQTPDEQAEQPVPEPTPEAPAPETPPVPEPAPIPEPETPAQPASLDPLAALPPERRAALLALDEAMQQDPNRRDAVFRAMAPPPPAPEPQLPEEIDPQSFEARLWHENRQLEQRLEQLSRGVAQLADNSARTSAQSAAEQGIAAFAAQHPEFSSSEVQEIVNWAGRAGIPSDFVGMSRYRDNPSQAIHASLNFALRENEQFEAKAASRTQGGEVTPPAVTAQQVADAEATQRKRTLTALSGAATPGGASPPGRAPLSTRSDGRFDPQSRSLIVDELAQSLNRARAQQQG